VSFQIHNKQNLHFVSEFLYHYLEFSGEAVTFYTANQGVALVSDTVSKSDTGRSSKSKWDKVRFMHIVHIFYDFMAIYICTFTFVLPIYTDMLMNYICKLFVVIYADMHGI
jgi:hypothetical protein